MPLEIDLSRQPVRFMKKLARTNKADSRKILSRLEDLPNNPKPPQAARVTGYAAEIYRIRVGDYRIIYSFDDETLRIGVIGRRNDVYQKLHTLIQSGVWQP